MKHPSQLHSMMELRAFYEAGSILSLIPWILASTKLGDNHPVIVLPGFGFGDGSTALLRTILKAANYDARDWGLGRNVGPSAALEKKLVDLLVRTYGENGHKVTLIGWSLGGLYSRFLANDYPNLVRRVITLGSPHKTNMDDVAIKDVFERFSPTKTKDLTPADMAKVRRTPDVPTTSIYTKTDGIVSWEDCLNDPVPHAENVEVHGSHAGLCYNYQAIQIILDRLRIAV